MIRTMWTPPMACGLVLALAQPAVAAEPAPSEPRHATVEIDTSDIGEEGPVIKRRTRERTDVVLRAAGVLPGRPDAGDPVIFVDVDELTGTEPGYQCEVWISYGGQVLGERRRVECTLCTETEIVQRVESTVGELIELLPAGPPPDDGSSTEPNPDPTPSSDTPSDSATTPSTEADGRRRLGTLGKAGAALIAVGVAGAAAGAVLVALPPKVDEDDPLSETNYRPPGAATLAAGAAVLVAGVVMLVVDRRRARKRTTALVPTLSPNAAGIVWSGRF
jgi:hypothetical protein